ncbi:MAG TPA: UV DNA damage repair endonuclease UvsE [Pirellulales bacterium]|nr:UV DNA damage repair endonuclease UvsE [Pirellulales bacterium]
MSGSLLSSTRLRLGLCCQFADEPIRFRTTTAASLLRLGPQQRREKLSRLCLENADSLLKSLEFCAEHGIGCFRAVSTILPIKTHPEAGYAIGDLPAAEAVIAAFRRCGVFARDHDIRLVFHPDQFVVLNSPHEEVVRRSIADLEYHAEVAEWIGADVINIHAGGAYGHKGTALAALLRNLDRLSHRARQRLAIENDDTVYTPADLLPFCRRTRLPLVYDVHHHRCLPDGLSVERASADALGTWDREPLFHISSPAGGWAGPNPKCHHDYIDAADFPPFWQSMTLTVEVEAKAKELAVLRLMRQLCTGERSGATRSSRAVRQAVHDNFDISRNTNR